MAWNSQRIRIWKKLPPDENYYGLGDKAGPMNHRDHAFLNWNTDAFGWGESTDPLYKTIPFFIGLRKGAAYGLFFDNTYRSSFDFGKESPDYFSFGAEGGELNYYFFAGPDPKKVIAEYTALVGRASLPPLWSLGYQQCRYSYYPEARAREVVRLFREKKIPADVIYFDIDYQQGYAPFTINREYFPHFEQMIADFRAQGFHTIAITDLHIKKRSGPRLRSVRFRNQAGRLRQESRRLHFRRPGLARRQRLPRFHAFPRARLVGRPLQRFRQDGRRRFLE